MAHHHHRKLSVCPNCGQSLSINDNFCPNCGQQNHELRLPFGHLVYEVVEGFTHFDGKLWVTLRDIFTRPGRVPLDFIEGRRQRHVPPIRLYIFVSFLLFLLIGIFSNSSLQRGALRNERLEAAYGADPAYREVTLTDIYPLLNVPAPNLRGIQTVAIQFGPTDSTGTQTLRRWHNFTNAQLDSVLSLYNTVVFDAQIVRLREAVAVLPAQLPWLPLLEPVNTKERSVSDSLKILAGIDTTLAVILRFAPDDTLGTALYTRLKALSTAQRMRYAEVNNAARNVVSVSVIKVQRGGNADANKQFARLIDVLKPRPANDPIRFTFSKGDGQFGGFDYTTEAAARADVVKMRQMTPDERLAYFKKHAGMESKKIDFLDSFFLRKSINRYVHDFDKSVSEINATQENSTLKYISYGFFLLMPLVAVFLLYLFYRHPRKYYYVDHLIFSINMHTVGFILFIVIAILLTYTPLAMYATGDAVRGLLLFATGPVLYVLLSLRTVFQQSWPITLLKFLLFAVLYSVTFSVLILSTLVMGIL